MATITVSAPAYSLGKTATSWPYTVNFLPPANVDGKLCRLSIDEFMLYDDAITTWQIFTMSADFSQPYGIAVTCDPATSLSTFTRNQLLCCNYANVPYNPSGRSILVQLPEGPINMTFTLSAAGSRLVTTANTLPVVYLKFTLLPVDKNNHFEKLESFSTGPFVRI